MDLPVKLGLLITVLPLAAFVIQIFFGRKLPRKGDWLPTAAVGAGLAMSLYLVVGLFQSKGGMEPAVWSMNWFAIGESVPFRIDFPVMIDNLSVVMLFVVTLVSFLVHLFSMGYMKGEERYHNFYAYLALFTFSMLGLIITSSILMLFIFWELVGFCSYLLIGFFWKKPSAAAACKKAFLTNRVGDTGFFLGIMMIWAVVGSFGFADIYESVRLGEWNAELLTVAGLLVFLGAVTKSAQFPLHIWLPDAMEGPTPVSALIHAATMVAAGVYMVCRMFPFIAGWDDAGNAAMIMTGEYWNSTALEVIAITGAVTALFAATIAVVQYDIKKVLAYSTVSQLGYMVVGVGVGSVSAAMFHLFTHAMFKACLFLGSGSVIHGMHHEQDMRKMGGLRHKMPVTYKTFLIATLALAGLPFFSGMISKEAILTQAMAYWNQKEGATAALPFLFCTMAAGLTSFYMLRLVINVFFGKPRDQHAYDHAHESPRLMTVPLMVLAVMSVIGAGLAIPGGPGTHWFQDKSNQEVLVGGMMTHPEIMANEGMLAARFHESYDPDVWRQNGQYHHVYTADTPANLYPEVDKFHHEYHHAHWPVFGIATLIGGLGILLAWWFFSKNAGKEFIKPGGLLSGFRRVLSKLYFVDEFYLAVPIAMTMWLGKLCAKIDRKVVDGLVNIWTPITRSIAWIAGRIDYLGVDGAVRGTGEATLLAGGSARRLQTGRIQDYVGLTVFGMGVVLAVVLVWNSYFGS